MAAQLFTQVEPMIVAGALAVTAVSAVFRKWIEEKFRTKRLIASIEGANPRQRSRIIRACSELEARSRHEDRPEGGPQRPPEEGS